METMKLTKSALRDLILEEINSGLITEDADSVEPDQKKKKTEKYKDALRIKSIILQVSQISQSGEFKNSIEDVDISVSDNVLVNLSSDAVRNDTDKEVATRLQAILPLMKLTKNWFISPEAYSDNKKQEFLTISSD